MTARPIDAAEGYKLFVSHSGAIELDEINEYLRGVDLRPVSPRMLVHYRRLFQHGYRSYITINRFDIAVASDHAWSDEQRARYAEIAQSVPAEVIWGAARYPAEVSGLGAATATVWSSPVPQAGTSLVLHLQMTGIERTGTVVRSDPQSGRFHVAFDPYTSVPVAPHDSHFSANVAFALSDDAESVVAINDLMLKLDRLLIESATGQQELVRVSRLSMNSPLELLLIGGPVVALAVCVLNKVIVARKNWYEGTKEKYEAEGIQLDNDQKRRNAQLEADRELRRTLRVELHSHEGTPQLDELATPGLRVGDPESPERLRLVQAAEAAIDLPIDTSAEAIDLRTTDPDGPNVEL